MRNIIIKYSYKYLLIAGLLVLHIKRISAQPTPGDSNLGAASGNVVGGGADLADGLWISLFLAVIFITYSYFRQLKAMQAEEA